ncbi:K02A2.6-like [Cordylochernes scorpioides]|uniref:RNA-directed DNA polymerase n=1 Tax=Cordylochernes scorpioides TaxID=51811 RepID=A0ABY6LTC3_9ARAC|nr:K02A2.6-like [Cordylochernes scorpioides]
MNKIPYRQTIGSLMYLMTGTRPDIAYAVSRVSQFMNNPGPSHWTAVKKIFGYLKATKNIGICFGGGSCTTSLIGFSDADFAGDLDTRKSTTGYVFLLNNGPISWCSQKQNCVSLSTTESEYIAASKATKETIWLRQLLRELYQEQAKPTTIFCDNQSCIRLVHNPEYHKRTKHIDISYHFIRDHFQKHAIDLLYVCSNDQAADIFTKALPPESVRVKMADQFLKPPKPLEQSSKEAWDEWIEAFIWYEKAVQLEKKPQEVQVAIFMASIGQLAQKIYKTFKLNEGEENKLQELKDLNITKAIQICVAAENANTQLREIEDRNESEPSISTIERKISRDFSQKAFNPRDTTSFKKLINNCTRCGAKHEINKCPAYGKVCHKCKKANHFSKLCKTAKRERVVNLVEDTEVESDEFSLSINEIKTRNGQEWLERVTFKGNQTVDFKLDTGAQCNVIPLTLSKKLKLKINSSRVRKLLTYSGESIRVMGETNVTCTIKSKAVVLRFIISEKGITPILGRDACSQLGLIYRVDEVCPEMEFEELFKGIGLIRNYKYKADFSEIPKNLPIKPARKIPFAIKANVKKELDEMEALGIIKKVNHPTPISSHMVIVRKDGKIRICLDPSDLNKILLRREFPLKRLEDIAVTLHKSKYFTKLDLKKSFWQLPVDEETQPYLTFSTPWGRYSFLRVPFGNKTAPEIMQQIMTDLLSDIKGVENSMDDILIHAPDLDTLRKRTYEVLSLLKSTGIKLNKEKCVFGREQVKFLGHLISKAGIQIDPGKVKAINEIQSPRNRKELQRLLGMIQYLQSFIPNASEKTSNMRMLLKKNVVWNWDPSLDNDLEEIKIALKKAPALKFFNPNAALTMSVDASSHAVGAVLMQDNRPIAFASATLIDYQRNYPQIEKEALAIKFGCRKFHEYIFGRPILVETDHKPLETIFKKCLSKSPLRLQRILLELQAYDLKVKYVREAKERLLRIFKDGESKRIRKLLSGIELGDLKPSQLLQKLKSSATEDLSDKIIKTLWLEKLPQAIQQILIISEEELDKLAVMADRIAELNPKAEIYEADNPENETKMLLKKIESLEQKIESMTMEHQGRSRDRSSRDYRYNARSRSRSKGAYNPKGKFCYFHYRYGKNCLPGKCKKPCAWVNAENSNQQKNWDHSERFQAICSQWNRNLHIPIAEEDKPKTAIITPFGLYEFNVMSFGLRNAPATFQRFIREVLRGLDFTFPYLDDILVASETHEEHETHLKLVLEKLQNYGLRINIAKSILRVDQLEFLGHWITNGGSQPLPSKVQTILDYKLPTTKRELRTFLEYMHMVKPIATNHNVTKDIFIHKDLFKSDQVFLRINRIRKPLEPYYEGPYPVLEKSDKYFTLKIKNREVKISIDRLKPAYILRTLDQPASSGDPIIPASRENPIIPASREDPIGPSSKPQPSKPGVRFELPKETRSGRRIKTPSRYNESIGRDFRHWKGSDVGDM